MNGLYEVLDVSAGRPGDDGQERRWRWGSRGGGARSEAEIKDAGMSPALIPAEGRGAVPCLASGWERRCTGVSAY